MSGPEMMSHGREQQEAAALAALQPSGGGRGEGPPELVLAFREVAACIAESVVPVTPAPALRDRLMARVADYQILKPIADVRQSEGAWVSAGIPGVETKTLFRDPANDRTTMLVRMQPGASLPAHRHHDDEQCLVLQGDIRWRDIVYEEGDFVVMGRDSNHPLLHSERGNLLLLVAGRNEYVRG